MVNKFIYNKEIIFFSSCRVNASWKKKDYKASVDILANVRIFEKQ